MKEAVEHGKRSNYGGAHSYLFRNDGGGEFSDVSDSAGIRVQNPLTGHAMAKALAITFPSAPAAKALV